jgi:hypothetical protein
MRVGVDRRLQHHDRAGRSGRHGRIRGGVDIDHVDVHHLDIHRPGVDDLNGSAGDRHDGRRDDCPTPSCATDER